MNDSLFDNAPLDGLEARLARLVPQLPPVEQQQLLYRCAFSAGQTEVKRTLRRWQAVAAGLVVLALGLCIPLMPDQPRLAKRRAELAKPAEAAPQPMFAQQEIPSAARHVAAVELDAWQLQPAETSLASELAHFEQTDPHLRSLAVGMLTRAVWEP